MAAIVFVTEVLARLGCQRRVDAVRIELALLRHAGHIESPEVQQAASRLQRHLRREPERDDEDKGDRRPDESLCHVLVIGR